MLNRLAVKFARSYYARKIGIQVDRESYIRCVWQASQKLFIESYFDLAICSFINIMAFEESKDSKEFAKFFETRDDIICSLITFIYTTAVFIMPIIGYKLI